MLHSRRACGRLIDDHPPPEPPPPKTELELLDKFCGWILLVFVCSIVAFLLSQGIYPDTVVSVVGDVDESIGLTGGGELPPNPKESESPGVASSFATTDFARTVGVEGHPTPTPICLLASDLCVHPFHPPKRTSCPSAEKTKHLGWFDKNLADYVIDVIIGSNSKIDFTKRVLLFGAGAECYSHYWTHMRKVSFALPVDGIENIIEPSNGLRNAGVTDTHLDFDWVVALFSFAHVTEGEEHALVRNLAEHAVEGIIVSWGDGDKNVANERVVELMRSHSFEHQRKQSRRLRDSVSTEHAATRGLFQNTIMVFIHQTKL